MKKAALLKLRAGSHSLNAKPKRGNPTGTMRLRRRPTKSHVFSVTGAPLTHGSGPVGSRSKTVRCQKTARNGKPNATQFARPDDAWSVDSRSRVNGLANAFAASANRQWPGARADPDRRLGANPQRFAATAEMIISRGKPNRQGVQGIRETVAGPERLLHHS